MKRLFRCSCAAFLFHAGLAVSPLTADDGLALTGSTVASLSGNFAPGYKNSTNFSYSFEDYANLRLKAAVGEYAFFFAAMNLVAVSGNAALDSPSFVKGQGYSAAIELERLYFKAEGELFDAEVGLMRLPFGFGLAWSPSDFLTRRNPLTPDARPRGCLAIACSAYPTEGWKVKVFTVAPDDASRSSGSGIVTGISQELHLLQASFQALYAWKATDHGVHYFGFSSKVEPALGLVVDALYRLDVETMTSGTYCGKSWHIFRGLEASAGIDASFFDGDVYVLLQYLYNGPGYLDVDEGLDALYDTTEGWYEHPPSARQPGTDVRIGELNRKHYLYASATYRLDDYTRATLSCATSIDDRSILPLLVVEHEPFQGMALSFGIRVPGDAARFGGTRGEFGPDHTGTLAQVSIKAKLKF